MFHPPFHDCLAASVQMLSRAIERIYRKHLDAHQLTTTQFTLLAAVSEAGHVAQSDLARALVLDRSSVSRDLQRLKARELFVVDGPRNRLGLALSKAGKRLLKRARPAWEAALSETQTLLGPEAATLLTLRNRAVSNQTN